MICIIILIIIFIFIIITTTIESESFDYEKSFSTLNDTTIDIHKQIEMKLKNKDCDLSTKIDCPIYYINMDDNIDRNKWMIQQLEKFNIKNYKRIAGIDMNNNNIQFKTEYDCDLDKTGSNNDRKKYGCLFAHIKCAVELLESNRDYGLVCEDDACFSMFPLMDFNLSELIKLVPQNWHIINLFNLFCCSFDKNGYIELYKRKKCTVETCWSTVCYILSREGAQNIIDTVCNDKSCNNMHIKYTSDDKYPINMVADDYLYGISNTYYCSPCLVYPYNPNEDGDFTKNIQDVMKFLSNHIPKLDKEKFKINDLL